MPFLSDAQIQKMVNRAVAKALRGDQAKTVSEIVGADEPQGSAFHRACEKSGAVAHAAQRAKLVSRLNGGYITPADVAVLRQDFADVHDLESLIASRTAGLRVE